MPATSRPEYEAMGGPFDGSLLIGYGPETLARVFEHSATYRYVLTIDDTGAKFWRFAGMVSEAGV